MTQSLLPRNEVLLDRVKKVNRLIGNTPLYLINRVFKKENVLIYAKLEWQQLGGSVKSRPAFQIIKEAILSGELNEQKRLLDATSGNTGIAYATIGAALGIGVTLVIPENASKERLNILKSLGAEIILSSKFEGTDGAQQYAKTIYKKYPNQYFYADQYSNEHNWKAHFDTTAVEILNQTFYEITHFVAGLGTTGTFTGVGRRLKKLLPQTQLIALQPNNPMHGLEGWKHLETAIVPPIYDNNLATKMKEVDTIAAFDLVKEVAEKEGLLISPSAAANLLGAIQVAKEIDRGVIVTTFADNSDKYGDVNKKIFGE